MSKKPQKKRAAARPGKSKPDAAARALAEAEARRKVRDKSKPAPAKEIGGRGGLDPARYGDWEKDGIVSDF